MSREPLTLRVTTLPSRRTAIKTESPRTIWHLYRNPDSLWAIGPGQRLTLAVTSSTDD